MPEVTIIKATKNDHRSIANIGKVSVEEAHRDSCSQENMNEFLESTYNDDSIIKELEDKNNIYHIIRVDEKPVGFSKIIFNHEHPNIAHRNIAKLDRIYLLKEFFGLKLGHRLLDFNVDLSRKAGQSGIWLFTWIGNKRAVGFYHKAGFRIVGSHKFKVTETHYNEHHQMYLDLIES